VISQKELGRRLDAVRVQLQARGLDALVQFSAVYNVYLTGFAHSPTERPIVLIVPVEGDVSMVIPLLEEDHVREHVPVVQKLNVYREYPGQPHPMAHLANHLRELGLDQARLGIDSDGHGSTYGYQGPALSAVLPETELVNVRDILDRLRVIRSQEEIDLVRSCVPWGNRLMEIIRDHVRPGVSELEASLRAFTEASAELLAEMGEAYRGYDNGSIPVLGGFVAGPKTGLPHPIDDGRALQRGDVLIAWGGPRFSGYHAELERTMILGPVSNRQRELFEIMVDMQQVALNAIRPGIPCSDVDNAVIDFAKRRNVFHLTRHHSFQIHEAPFLDSGDATILEPGMMFSCEPGIYELGLGGFRHSDSVLVTQTGAEILTNYPRDLKALII
jgi:Xaa-Pro aminopeptidase